MFMKVKFFSCLFFSLYLIQTVAQERVNVILGDDWKFHLGEHPEAIRNDFDDTTWTTVSVPHDWAIHEPFDVNGNGDTGKLPWKNEGWYRKKLNVDSSLEGKNIYLLFDGAMSFPKIYVNGQLAGQWDYGYNSFYVDITDFVQLDKENSLVVQCNTQSHDSRWYPGGGLFRKVTLIVTNPIHIDIWGTYITTPKIDKASAEVTFETSITNSTDDEQQLQVKYTIFDSQDNLISKDIQTINSSPSGQTVVAIQTTIAKPKLWDIDSPELYSLETEILQNGRAIDHTITTFGIKESHFTSNDGFYLNGRRVQLKGVNLHSDLGPLGMAFNKSAAKRQLTIMKEMGVNAIRNSHNVAAPEVLELCDEMGLLFLNEIFDKYDGKADITSETDFDEFAHRNVKNFVLRDRNHPSVFLWSVGNEIGDVQWNLNGGFDKLQTMVSYVRQYDGSRPTTLVCDNLESAKLRHFDYYDVHSWNYGRRYRLARELEPNKAVIISESASTVSTRGFYELPLPTTKTDFTSSLQVSSYDLNAPEWAEISDDDFMWQEQEPFVAGEFVWTGFDYLGEPTPYNNGFVNSLGFTDKEASRSSYFGIVDLVGIPKDRFYLYKSHWRPKDPVVHLLPHWNWEGLEGSIVPVFAYTNGDRGELFVNGISQGMQYKKPESNISIERYRLIWPNVIYEPGEIKIVAYKGDQFVGEKTIRTASTAHHISATVDRESLQSGDSTLAFVTLEAFDKSGNPCPLADNLLNIQLEGPLEIAGLGNGNPQSFEPFLAEQVKLFYGKAVVIIKSKNLPGIGKMVITSNGLLKEELEIQVD